MLQDLAQEVLQREIKSNIALKIVKILKRINPIRGAIELKNVPKSGKSPQFS